MKPEKIKAIDTVPRGAGRHRGGRGGAFFRVTSIDLDDAQRDRILTPPMSFPRQKSVLGIRRCFRWLEIRR